MKDEDGCEKTMLRSFEREVSYKIWPVRRHTTFVEKVAKTPTSASVPAVPRGKMILSEINGI